MTQTIEQLTARVRELEEENARLNGVIESNIDDGIDKIMAMSDEQVSALAAFEGSKPEDKATIARQCMYIAMLRVDLAASQAYAEQLREACAIAEKTIDIVWVSHHANRCDHALELCRSALSQPTSTEALDAYVEEKVKEARRTAEYWKSNHLAGNEQIATLTRQRDLAVEALEKQGHSAGCRKNAFGDVCTCGLDDLLSTIKESEAMAQGEK